MASRDVEPAILEKLGLLRGYDKLVYRFARLISATSGTTIKPVPRARHVTVRELVLEHLSRIGAVDFDSGQSASQIANAIGYSVRAVHGALNKLIDQKLVIGEQRGRNIRYYLAPT